MRARVVSREVEARAVGDFLTSVADEPSALVIEGEERIRAPVEKVWAALNDPDVLRACIPGCETLEKS